MVGIIFLLMTLVGLSPVNAQVAYTYERMESRQEDYLKIYPQNVELLDQFNQVMENIRVQVGMGEYREASKTVQTEIRAYEFATDDPGSLTLLSALIRMDAAIDMYLLNDKRSGANKNYIISYIVGRSKLFSSTEIVLDYQSVVDAVSIIGNGYEANDAKAFRFFASDTYYFLQGGIYHEGLTDYEGEYTCCYYEIHDRSESGAGAVWPELMYDYLVRDLFIMSDYKSDIRLYCNSKKDVREACEKAASYSRGESVPILDSPYYGVHVAVTYRKAKAAEFFKQYYGD